uniref:Ribosomal protein S10 n=1 Tax=Stegastes partitus TaxID=144197 RepID=A0A3B4YYG2_9TELE
MLMPKKNRIAIYELLFKEGVMVAKKDVHLAKHPELADKNVPNLHVMKAMQSLKSCGYVKEQFETSSTFPLRLCPPPCAARPALRPEGPGPREWKERGPPALPVERQTEMHTGDLLHPLVLTRKQRLVLELPRSSSSGVASDAAEDSSLSRFHCLFLYNKENQNTTCVCVFCIILFMLSRGKFVNRFRFTK